MPKFPMVQSSKIVEGYINPPKYSIKKVTWYYDQIIIHHPVKWAYRTVKINHLDRSTRKTPTSIRNQSCCSQRYLGFWVFDGMCLIKNNPKPTNCIKSFALGWVLRILRNNKEVKNTFVNYVHGINTRPGIRVLNESYLCEKLGC